ncbi:hypothetical protein KFL_000340320 [Klebsormidium nitens]|uniref:LRRK2 ARM repeat domain-containing protein n=1 Tax=Klebsormidium nitens TaxID=105231 RepID=A0A1Y1HR22_KLENI|nr:hypothetical protein KFL_000340320 [Klebsormidium nitens]|eukprot:GAQ79629.1 hypothetical protein KFL_000340320 [Klebsormidium nitens]
MAPKSTKVKVSQEAFDAAVKENIEEFDMEPDEAVSDAVKTFEMQGADLSGIITKPGGAQAVADHPASQALQALEKALQEFVEGGSASDAASVGTIEEALGSLNLNCKEDGAEALVGRSGGVRILIDAVNNLGEDKDSERLAGALDALGKILSEYDNKEAFLQSSGPDSLLASLRTHRTLSSLVARSSEVIATASTKHEGNKVQFMEGKAEELLIDALKTHSQDAAVVRGAAAALQAFATADDFKALSSKGFRHALLIGKADGVDAVLGALKVHQGQPETLAALCGALTSLAANDDICKQVQEAGGLDSILAILRAVSGAPRTSEAQNVSVAASALGLLQQLGKSDANKERVVELGGLDTIVNVLGRYHDSPAVLHQGLAALAALTLRNAKNADLAFRARAADCAVEALESQLESFEVQRQACQLIRNLAVRNVDNRGPILEKGVEPLIRRAGAKYPRCKDEASAALRDLGLDDYKL